MDSDLRDAILAHLASLPEGDSAHDMGHLLRVEAVAACIAAAEGAHEALALTAASLLHDCVAAPKSSPLRSRASRMAADHARVFLRGAGLAESSVATACHAIEAHSFSAGVEPLSPEARALQDADRLDALGAIGAARCFAVSGATGRALFDPADPLARGRPLDEGRWALDHFSTKLLGLPATMKTRTGRCMAADRAAFLVEFMHRIAREQDGTA